MVWIYELTNLLLGNISWIGDGMMRVMKGEGQGVLDLHSNIN